MRTCGLILLAAIAGCGGDGTVSTASVPPAPSTPGITMVDVGVGAANAFSPQSVTIHPGDSVQWSWMGGPHTVTSGVPGGVDGVFCSLPEGTPPSATACDSTSYAEGAGATYTHTFLTTGSFRYFCTVHGAMMTGSVIVSAGD